ncbi:MAG: 4Fe-4S dicluster domain-containing protein [Rikenellaceae bacterium]
MNKRDIIKIEEALCNGCGKCVAGCHEGALQMIGGKARIVSELYCDGLGACIGDCPVGAISIEQREAEAYDEVAVMERIAAKGAETILAHLKHLKDHNEMGYLKQGIDYLKEHNIEVDLSSIEAKKESFKLACGCPGTASRTFSVAPSPSSMAPTSGVKSQLTHFPVQLHLVNPSAGHFAGAELLLAADCTAFAYGDFHGSLLRGRKLVIACPKLDSDKESYITKIVAMIDSAKINTLTVAIMSVPCCGGLLQIAKVAAQRATRKVPIKVVVIGTEGSVMKEEWV